MSDQIKGLLTQKPESPAPEVGRTLHFTTENRTSEKGVEWTKVKNDRENGKAFRVLSADRTDFVDRHGNISYNVLIEEAGHSIGGAGSSNGHSDREASMAYAGSFNAAVAIVAAQIQNNLITPEQVLVEVSKWTHDLLPIRSAEGKVKGPWMESEDPETPAANPGAPFVSESRDEDIPF